MVVLQCTRGETNSKWFFQVDVSSKKLYNFSTCFHSFFLKKVKTPKRHFKITWPLLLLLRGGATREKRMLMQQWTLLLKSYNLFSLFLKIFISSIALCSAAQEVHNVLFFPLQYTFSSRGLSKHSGCTTNSEAGQHLKR